MSGQIAVVKKTSHPYRVEITRIREGVTCAECGLRKPTRKLYGKFLCSDCRQNILDKKESHQHGR